MRLSTTLALFAFTGLAGFAGFAGCYKIDQGALGDTPYKCSGTYPECPEGYMCVVRTPMMSNPKNLDRCVPINAGPVVQPPLVIPKNGLYMGPYTDNLNGNCPGMDHEPNNDFAHATQPLGDSRISKLGICPVGDIDVYALPVNGPTRVKVFFMVKNGDLDVGIFNEKGDLLTSDGGSANNVNDACVMISSPGSYYAVVLGAKNTQGTSTYMNGYELQIGPGSCDPPDMAMQPDLAE